MAATAYDKANKMADKALKGFKSAHSQLLGANEILAAEAEERRQEGIRWQAEVEAFIEEGKIHEERLIALAEKNQNTIDKLADLIGE